MAKTPRQPAGQNDPPADPPPEESRQEAVAAERAPLDALNERRERERLRQRLRSKFH